MVAAQLNIGKNYTMLAALTDLDHTIELESLLPFLAICYRIHQKV